MCQFDVTIAIPVFNAATFLEKSLRSALSQSVEKLEILILDDCSTDNSVEIIKCISKNYAHRLTLYTSPRNCGVGVMRNKALELAKGDYLFFMDCDDWITDDCIEVMLHEAKKHNADLVIGSHYDIRDGVEYAITEKQQIFIESDSFANFAFKERYGYVGGVWNKLMKTDCIRREHLFFPEYRVGEDVPFIFQLITKVMTVVILEKKTYYYLIRSGSLCQYNSRAVIPHDEIETHIASKFLLKDILANHIKDSYYMSMLCVVMDYCLDTVRAMIEKRNILEKQISLSVFNDLLAYPVPLRTMLRYGNRRDVINCVLCNLPICVTKYLIIIRKTIREYLPKWI